ncbi:uncharacterized protein LOC131943349 [Physella acuta]|uniref:uncharacterized protein LOC131943349 n=1 Tax=Physella acuta TaxID=109671 RepID=UPI0027DE0446|nr:uncharacterized protein LOC131943349 [Physella acuta]XP_059159407.1 uncharacterized protein LOC131943349 [Physella acuta]
MASVTSHSDIEPDARPEIEQENSSVNSSSALRSTAYLQSARPISSSDDPEYLRYLFLFPDELREDNIDILIINAENDSNAARSFKKHLEKDIIVHVNGMTLQPRVKLLEDFRIGSSLEYLDFAFSKTLYVFLYVTKEFCSCTWSLLKGQACLVEAIQDKEKKWCVIPVHTKSRKNQDYKLPMMLGSLRPINYWVDDIDQFYSEGVRKLLDSRIRLLLERDITLQKQRLEYFNANRQKLLQLSNRSKTNYATSASPIQRKYPAQAEDEQPQKVQTVTSLTCSSASSGKTSSSHVSGLFRNLGLGGHSNKTSDIVENSISHFSGEMEPENKPSISLPTVEAATAYQSITVDGPCVVEPQNNSSPDCSVESERQSETISEQNSLNISIRTETATIQQQGTSQDSSRLSVTNPSLSSNMSTPLLPSRDAGFGSQSITADGPSVIEPVNMSTTSQEDSRFCIINPSLSTNMSSLGAATASQSITIDGPSNINSETDPRPSRNVPMANSTTYVSGFPQNVSPREHRPTPMNYPPHVPYYPYYPSHYSPIYPPPSFPVPVPQYYIPYPVSQPSGPNPGFQQAHHFAPQQPYPAPQHSVPNTAAQHQGPHSMSDNSFSSMDVNVSNPLTSSHFPSFLPPYYMSYNPYTYSMQHQLPNNPPYQVQPPQTANSTVSGLPSRENPSTVASGGERETGQFTNQSPSGSGEAVVQHIHHHHHHKKEITVQNATNLVIGDQSKFIKYAATTSPNDDDDDDETDITVTTADSSLGPTNTERTPKPNASHQNQSVPSADGARASQVTTPPAVNSANEAVSHPMGFAEISVPPSIKDPVEDSELAVEQGIDDLSRQTFVKKFIS